jgi:type VI secretion system protein ImpA
MREELQPLLSAISPEAPSGVDLEYDADFARMEKSAQGTPDQEFGSTRIEGTPPDWLDVRKAAISILRRSKDLRAATYLAESELSAGGIPGFRDALELMSVFLNEFWDSVYPQLDPDDDDDPTSRINSLAGLTKAGGVLRQIRAVVILSCRSVGRFSWTDCAIAKGEVAVPAGMEEPPTQKKIDAAVASADLNELTQMSDAVADSLKFINSIEKVFSDRLGAGYGPNLEGLGKELKAIARYQKTWLAQRQDDQSQSSESQDEESNEDEDAGEIKPKGIVAGGPFVIQKREDAIEALDKIIRWFASNEPSSPLPMLLRRAKRLSSMSFIEILKDISPDGVSQAVLIGGNEPEEEKIPEPAPKAPASKPSNTSPKKPAPASSNDDY